VLYMDGLNHPCQQSPQSASASASTSAHSFSLPSAAQNSPARMDEGAMEE
jgi:hypothetical protein